jgi:hypothetical protein
MLNYISDLTRSDNIITYIRDKRWAGYIPLKDIHQLGLQTN